MNLFARYSLPYVPLTAADEPVPQARYNLRDDRRGAGAFKRRRKRTAQSDRYVRRSYLSQTIPWIAKQSGIFAKHGIDADVILLTGSPRAVQTLLAGDIEYEGCSDSPVRCAGGDVAGGCAQP